MIIAIKFWVMMIIASLLQNSPARRPSTLQQIWSHLNVLRPSTWRTSPDVHWFLSTFLFDLSDWKWGTKSDYFHYHRCCVCVCNIYIYIVYIILHLDLDPNIINIIFLTIWYPIRFRYFFLFWHAPMFEHSPPYIVKWLNQLRWSYMLWHLLLYIDWHRPTFTNC